MSLKPETVEKLTGFFSITTDEDAEKFIADYPNKFVPRDKAHTFEDVSKQAVGVRMKSITSMLVDLAKKVDPNATFNSLNEERVEDVIKSIDEKFTGKLGEYETKLKEGSDKRVNDLTKTLQDKDLTINSYKEANEKLSGEYEQFKTSKENDIKKYKIGHQFNEIKSKIPFIDGMTEIQKAGYNSFLNENFQLDLDEKDNLIIKDKEGKLIQNKKKAGSFSDPFEVMTEIAEQNNLIKKNNAQPGKTFNFTQKKDESQNNNNGADTSKLSSTYLQRVAEINKNGG